jgi:uncharacterized protein (TIGR02453 family)
VPGFYLHLELGDCMGGGGIYHPDPVTLRRIRLAIVEDTRGWAAVTKAGLEIEGDRLTRAPAGIAASHPLIDDLRLKDFYALEAFSQREVCAPGFFDRYVACCEHVSPLVSFLTRALGLKW